MANEFLSAGDDGEKANANMAAARSVTRHRQNWAGIKGGAYRSTSRAFEFAHFIAEAGRTRGALAVDEAGTAWTAAPLAVGGGVRLAQRAFAFDAQIATVKRFTCDAKQSPC